MASWLVVQSVLSVLPYEAANIDDGDGSLAVASKARLDPSFSGKCLIIPIFKRESNISGTLTGLQWTGWLMYYI